MEIKPEAFSYALKIVDDGWVFESFAQSFLSAVLNYDFMPHGGVKDKGIDGLQHLFYRKSFTKVVFQLSTEKDAIGKIRKTVEVLLKNSIKFDSLTYVTNRELKNKDSVIDRLFEEYGINVRIFDHMWVVSNFNQSEATKNAYFTYLKQNLHEYNVPGKSFIVSGIETDSRIFVFLRQQLESKGPEFKIDEVLADSLILFSLEATDPEKKIFFSKEDIKTRIRDFIKFDPKLLSSIIDKRLIALSNKPRKIQRHRNDMYCLPFETRLEITQRNLSDVDLQKKFYEQTITVIKKYLQENDVVIKEYAELIDAVVQKIYYQQGLEFSNFVLHGDSRNTVDKDLQRSINIAVDESVVIEKNKEAVKSALLIAVRDIVYNGTHEQRRYLKSLSNTYMMMFLLQWNPQVALYFESMAANLRIFVCTSIIIPAFSEFYLEDENKRHWNLLKACRQAGIRLYISEPILSELISHLRMVKNKYESYFVFAEDIYLMSEMETLLIDEVLIRSYFHAKFRGRVSNFKDFLDNFCDPSVYNVKEDLVDYLSTEFGIDYKSDADLKVNISPEEQAKLGEKLHEGGKASVKANTDAKIILTIYKMRENNTEVSNSGIFGYKTWWLSKDTTTYRAVRNLFKEKYSVSCYMRPDFLYNHIALAPKKTEIDSMYKSVFPSLLGVNLSFHLPKETTEYVQKIIQEHGSKNPTRIKSIIRRLTEKLKTDPSTNLKSVQLFLDEQLREEGNK